MRELNYSMLPEHLRDGMRRYIDDGILPGEFLQAAICNNFRLATLLAINLSAEQMKDIAKFLHNEAPIIAHGNVGIMRNWEQLGGATGLQRKLAENRGQKLAVAQHMQDMTYENFGSLTDEKNSTH